MRAALLVLALTGCASASDVESRGRAVLDATDPEQHGYCPAVELARARTEVAIARAASQRGEPVVAALHLARAEELAAKVKAQSPTCGRPRPEPKPEPEPPKPEPEPPEETSADADGDGIRDVEDKCPLEREDVDGFVDDDGCPDDNDGDGLSDVIDKCPEEPEDLDGYEDLDGCPEPGP